MWWLINHHLSTERIDAHFWVWSKHVTSLMPKGSWAEFNGAVLGREKLSSLPAGGAAPAASAAAAAPAAEEKKG